MIKFVTRKSTLVSTWHACFGFFFFPFLYFSIPGGMRQMKFNRDHQNDDFGLFFVSFLFSWFLIRPSTLPSSLNFSPISSSPLISIRWIQVIIIYLWKKKQAWWLMLCNTWQIKLKWGRRSKRRDLVFFVWFVSIMRAKQQQQLFRRHTHTQSVVEIEEKPISHTII